MKNKKEQEIANIILLVMKEGSVKEVCKKFNLHTATVYSWFKFANIKLPPKINMKLVSQKVKESPEYKELIEYKIFNDQELKVISALKEIIGGKSVKLVSNKYGYPTTTIRRWVKMVSEDTSLLKKSVNWKKIREFIK